MSISFLEMDHALVDAILHSRGYTDAEITEIFQRASYMTCSPSELKDIMRDVTQKHNEKANERQTHTN